MIRSPQELLDAFQPRYEHLTLADYTKYIAGRLEKPEFTMEDIQVLCRYLACDITDLARRVAREKSGKG